MGKIAFCTILVMSIFSAIRTTNQSIIMDIVLVPTIIITLSTSIMDLIHTLWVWALVYSS